MLVLQFCTTLNCNKGGIDVALELELERQLVIRVGVKWSSRNSQL